MKKSIFGLMALALGLGFGDIEPGAGIGGVSLVKEAHAIVGRPLTPVSVAGVARRTTRRVIATTTYVATLPPACTVVVIEGTTLQKCGNTYYAPHGTQYVLVKVE
ncbi:MAG: hypothetical protein Q7T97_12375 [Burkholderiaceae bacterium]|nr:hypothetical protein [Burkholderiaceae bacterium]